MPGGIEFYFDWGAVIVITVAVFGFLAVMTGANLARNWHSLGMLAGYCALLAVGERFMAHALVWERFYILVDIYWTDDGVSFGFDAYYFVSLGVCLVAAALAFYATRASLMVRQYPWLYRRVGLVAWRGRSGGEPDRNRGAA